MRAALLPLALVVAACVEGAPVPAGAGAGAGARVEVDGRVMTARQMRDWPVMGWSMDPVSGRATPLDTGVRADTVIVSGSGGDRDLAIRAAGLYCTGAEFDPAAWDTQYVHRDDATGDYWFDWLCS